jgi:hypothetical protein
MLSAARVRTLCKVIALLAFVWSVVALRVVTSARQELIEADAYRARADIDSAIVHYRRAARWYAPGSPYHVQALQHLAELGHEAQQQGDRERALLAYRSLRSAIMATRSAYVPEPARLRAANQRIAALMSELPPPGMDAGKSKAQLQREHLALLEAVPGPNVFWTCVLLCGFFGWVAAAFAFSARAIDEDDRWVVPEARRWGALIALGFGLFVLGMALA